MPIKCGFSIKLTFFQNIDKRDIKMFHLFWKKLPQCKQDTDYKPVPLKTGESEDYVLALKQELRETVKRMPYFVETPEEKQGAYWTPIMWFTVYR